jgi:hypothetical protein
VHRVSHLAIGGLRIAVRCDDPRISCRFNEPTRRFLTDAAGANDVELNVRALDAGAPRGGELVFDSGAVWRLFRGAEGFRIECSSEVFGDEPYKVATFDDAFSRGEIALRTEATGDVVDPLEYPLDEVLVAHLLGRGRGVELHSCGLVDREGNGRVFVGQSGAGKSTTARLWAGEGVTVLSDDRIIIREVDERMRMFGSPWHGEAALSAAGSAPLIGVYLLVQSTESQIRELAPAEAVARLFACAFPPFHDAAALAFTIGFLERLLASVPVRELRFTRDRSAIDVVRELQ